MDNSDKSRTDGGKPSDDSYYQPWLRNGVDAATAGPTGGVNRPAPLPTRKGADTPPPPPEPAREAARLSADELLARPIPLPGDPDTGAPGLGERVQAMTGKIGDWTGNAIERAGLGDRARAAANSSKKALERGAKASASALRAAAKATADAANRTSTSAAPHVRSAATKLKQGVVAGAKATVAATGSGGRKLAASARNLVDKTPAATLIPTRLETPPSQLEQLMAQEDERVSSAKGAANGLPLFTPAPTDAPPTPTVVTAPEVRDTTNAAPTPTPTPPLKPTAVATPQQAQATPAQPASAPRDVGAGDGSRWLRHPASWVAGGVALMFSGFIAGIMWDGGSNRAVTERIVHDYILNNPQIIPQAMEKLQADRVAATINDQRGAIETPFSGAWAGAADGDVTMVVFTDYACTFCRSSVADIDRLLREDRRLKVVFRELPILSADSEAAARVALSGARSGRYMAVHRGLFASGRPDADARSAVASQFSVPVDAARLADPAITRELRNNLQLARDLGFDGTPSWVIGDRAMTGAVGYETLRAAIAAARAAD